MNFWKKLWKKLSSPFAALIYSMLIVCFTIGTIVVIAFSWFTNTELVEPDLSGFSVSAYFGGGNGSEDDPFLIKNQRHLYNLCWLQYLGYFNKEGTLDNNGRIITQGHTTEITQYSFSIENDLNMNGWYLPPLGTTLNPFVGLLNGQGHKIYNLHTTNTFSEFGTRHPSSVNASNFANVEIIGFTGVIGTYSTMRLSDHSIDADANAIANIKLSNTQVRTQGETLAGIAVGYINGTVEDVGIVGGEIYFNGSSSVFGSMDDVSAYTVAGYATDGFVTRTSKTKAVVLNPTNTIKTNYVYENPGDSDAWGGSIDMLSLYNRYKNRGATALNTYVSDEIHYYNQDGTTYQEPVIINSFPDPSAKNTYGLNRYYYASYTDGSGAYLTMGAPGSRGYDYLTGLYKKVINIEVQSTTTGYKIKAPNINNYLSISSTRQGNTTNFNVTLETEGTTNANTATEWIQSSKNGGGNHLYTYNKDDGYQYYLNATPTSLTISDIGTTAWLYNANYGYYITHNNVNYYLRYINNEWTISNKLSYLITDNNENYLSRNNTAVTNVTDYTQATRWIFENENGVNGSSGIIYDENDTNYKLIINNNGNLACTNLNNNLTSWSNNGNNLYSGNKFIAYYNNAWRIYTENAKYIKYGNYYLTITSNNTINNTITDQENASSWTFSNNDSYPKGYLSTTIEDTTYYLSFNNANTNKLEIVTNQAQAIQLVNDGDGPYYTYNNVKYYLQYKNNIWQAAQAATKIDGYYISYNGHYLCCSSDDEDVFDTTNINDATVWHTNTNNNVYATIDGTNYYLYSRNNYGRYARVSDNSAISRKFTKYNNTIRYVRNNNNTYYLIYNNGTFNAYYNTTSTNLTWTNATVDDLENTPIPSIIANTSNVPYICDLSVRIPNMTRTATTTNVYYRNPDKEVPSVFNYVPLNTNNDYSVKDTNTGYIIAGGHSGVTANNLTDVDIRITGEVDNYSISGRLAKSVNTNGTIKTQNGQDLVYTYNSSGLKQLYQSGITYEKYTASRKNMEDTFKNAYQNNSGRLGGIHFMNSSISMDHMIVAPKVLINGQTYTNYQMPENAIDFNLKSKGFINFFAALYFGGNSTFFSLNHIIRNNDNTIKEINHITEIYQNLSNKSLPYIYKYTNQNSEGYYYSNNSNTLPSGYQCIFYTSWIETPSLENWDTSNYMTKLYYFEIPVNEGEYALGSVSGRDGGYLLYLDIGANAQQINRTEIRQKSVVSQYDYVYPNGIAIITENTTIDDAINNNSLDASKSSSFKVSSASANQSVVATRTSNTAINFTTDIANGVPVYIPRTVTVTKNNSAVQAAAVRTTTSIYSQIQYIDHNVTLGDIYETNIEMVTIDGVASTPTYNIYKIGEQGTTTGFTRYEVDLTVTNPEWRLYAVDTVQGTVKNILVDLTDNSDTYATAIKNALTEIANTTVTDANTALDYEYDTVTGATNTYAIHINMAINSNDLYYYTFTGDDITVTTDNTGGTIVYVTIANTTYTFKLNGTTMVVGTNIPVTQS